MAYRKFRNEELYEAPELGDMSFTKAAFQAMDAADAQRRGIAAQKEDAKNKHSRDVLSSLGNISPSQFEKVSDNQKKEAIAITNDVMANNGRLTPELSARANKLSTIANQNKGWETRLKTLDANTKELAKTYPFDFKAWESDLRKTNEVDDPGEVMSMVEKKAAEGEYLDLPSAINNFYKKQSDLAKEQSYSIKNEKNYTTSDSRYASTAPFTIKTGRIVGYKTTYDALGKEIKEPVYENKPATTPEEIIQSGAIDAMLKESYGADMLKKTKMAITDEEVILAAEKAAKKLGKGFVFNANGAPTIDPYLIETAREELAKKALAVRLADMHKFKEEVSNSITKENPPKGGEPGAKKTTSAGGSGKSGVNAVASDLSMGQMLELRDEKDSNKVFKGTLPVWMPNSISLVHVDDKGKEKPAAPTTYYLSKGRNSDGTTREFYSGSTEAFATSVYDQLYTGSGKNKKAFRYKAADQNGNELPAPTFDRLAAQIRDTPPDQEITVEPTVALTIVGKNNTGGTMNAADSRRLIQLTSYFSNKKGSDTEADTEQRREWERLKAAKENVNQTITSSDKGVWQKATGWGSQQDALNDPNVAEEVKERIRNSLGLQGMARRHNLRLGAVEAFKKQFKRLPSPSELEKINQKYFSQE